MIRGRPPPAALQPERGTHFAIGLTNFKNTTNGKYPPLDIIWILDMSRYPDMCPDIGTYVPISVHPDIDPDFGSDFHWTR